MGMALSRLGLGLGGGGAAPFALAAAPQLEPVLLARAIAVDVDGGLRPLEYGGGAEDSEKSCVRRRGSLVGLPFSIARVVEGDEVLADAPAVE